ncbi:hypothetical protein TIFTF001_029785 [Ficus carica]|uniref:Uncharacterized protein n=1 Tax=Ficus carica TaxID=3494 RepID=A0AA88J1Y4_FICCA|nr:hypothetical protein TIFTF001_029785 [Ficus carica]
MAGKRNIEKNKEIEDDKAEHEQFKGRFARKPWEPKHRKENWSPMKDHNARVSQVDNSQKDRIRMRKFQPYPIRKEAELLVPKEQNFQETKHQGIFRTPKPILKDPTKRDWTKYY